MLQQRNRKIHLQLDYVSVERPGEFNMTVSGMSCNDPPMVHSNVLPSFSFWRHPACQQGCARLPDGQQAAAADLVRTDQDTDGVRACLEGAFEVV
jgi:hypothetical protein